MVTAVLLQTWTKCYIVLIVYVCAYPINESAAVYVSSKRIYNTLRELLYINLITTKIRRFEMKSKSSIGTWEKKQTYRIKEITLNNDFTLQEITNTDWSN